MINELHIKNYRAFKEFDIDTLARVNLIVGKNNVGKTSLLEAIYLLNTNRPQRAIIDFFRKRGEIIRNIDSNTYNNKNRLLVSDVSDLFYKRKTETGSNIAIYESNAISITIEVSDKEDISVQKSFFSETDEIGFEPKTLFLVIQKNNHTLASFPIEDSTVFFPTLFSHEVDTYYLPTEIISSRNLAKQWDNINFTPKEAQIIQALQFIEPTIERVGFTSSEGKHNSVIVKLKDYNKPISISSMGEGIQRVLAIAISLVSAENSVLIVDEIDTGLHYSVQCDIWKLIFETARALNIQVFATTHSWDCVQAFQEALETIEHQDKDTIGQLIRLDRKKNHMIEPTTYRYETLKTAIEAGIEVR